MLSTTLTFAVLFALLAVAAAAVAIRAAARATEEAQALTKLRKKVEVVLEEHLVMTARLERLAGRVYQQARKPKVIDAEAETAGADADLAGALDPEVAAMLELQSAPTPQPR